MKRGKPSKSVSADAAAGSAAPSASDAGSMRPFSRSLPMQLMRAREAVMQRFRPHLHANGLTDQQWRVIRALVEVEALEILNLSEQCCIHPASLSRMLPKLEAEGFISRRVSKADQRKVIVSITPRGKQLFEIIAPQSEEIYAAIAREIGAERVQELYRLLDAMIERLSGGQSRQGRLGAAAE